MLKFRPGLMFAASSLGKTQSNRCARLRVLTIVLSTGLWATIITQQTYAAQIVFGSFKSSDNAANWALKLTARFAVPIQVTQSTRPDGIWYRVVSQELSTARADQIRRRADQEGIRYWVLRLDSESEPDKAQRQVRPSREQPLRLTPPSPARAPLPSAGASVEAPDATGELPQDPLLVPVIRPDTKTAEPQPGSWEWELGLQARGFAHAPRSGQDRIDASLSMSATYYRGWAADQHSVTFTPFVRLDSADSKRSHADVRELFYSRVGETWDVHVGAKRVFWGVTEFNHLIDIINQTDLVENIDTEDKLGQPMVQVTLVRDWGLLDAYVLTGFRERTYASVEGRLWLPWRIADAQYESGAEEYRTDFAIRWSHHLGPVELGIHHFSGTSRDPLFIPAGAALIPYYPVIDQTGLDAQAFYGDWAFKFEGFTRSGFGDRYVAFNAGLERTLVGVMASQADLGVVIEYMYDERGDDAFNTLFEDDIALGGRLRLNDLADTEALLGVIYDIDRDHYLLSLEASRRVADSWTVSLEGRVFHTARELPAGATPAILLDTRFKDAWLQDEDYLQVELKKYF